MIAKVLGSKTGAEQFLRHEARRPAANPGRVDFRQPKTFKPAKPVLRFEYWERHISAFPEWIIERYENGKLVKSHSGNDWQKRDELLIKLQAGGFACKPVTVAGVVPEPIKGRMRDKPKAQSQRKAILGRIGALSSEDLIDYPEDNI